MSKKLFKGNGKWTPARLVHNSGRRVERGSAIPMARQPVIPLAVLLVSTDGKPLKMELP